jgi:hypothetical protein
MNTLFASPASATKIMRLLATKAMAPAQKLRNSAQRNTDTRMSSEYFLTTGHSAFNKLNFIIGLEYFSTS